MTLPVKVKIEDDKVRFPFWIHVCVLVSLQKNNNIFLGGLGQALMFD